MGTSHGRVSEKKTSTGVIGNFQYFLFILAVNCASHLARPIISVYFGDRSRCSSSAKACCFFTLALIRISEFFVKHGMKIDVASGLVSEVRSWLHENLNT